MTPEEKAKELIEKFGRYVEIHHWDGKYDYKDVYSYNPKLSATNAKVCAVICVEETLKELQNLIMSQPDSDGAVLSLINHYKQILTIIEDKLVNASN